MAGADKNKQIAHEVRRNKKNKSHQLSTLQELFVKGIPHEASRRQIRQVRLSRLEEGLGSHARANTEGRKK